MDRPPLALVPPQDIWSTNNGIQRKRCNGGGLGDDDDEDWKGSEDGEEYIPRPRSRPRGRGRGRGRPIGHGREKLGPEELRIAHLDTEKKRRSDQKRVITIIKNVVPIANETDQKLVVLQKTHAYLNYLEELRLLQAKTIERYEDVLNVGPTERFTAPKFVYTAPQ